MQQQSGLDMAGAGPVARFVDVTKTYAEGAVNVTAIAGMSLTVPASCFATVIGPSGSGKTTLLNLVGCIDRATTGRVEVCGQDLALLSDRALTNFRSRHVAFVFQSFSLLPMLSAYENVEYPLLLLKTPARERRQRTLAMLEAVGLSAQAAQRPNQLSGGQRQRVALARALVKRPSLVLADEPTANLDSVTGHAVITLMQRIQHEQGATFVFSTHDPQLISRAEVTYTIRDGRLLDVVAQET